MREFIAPSGASPYDRGMASVVLRLLALVALLFMPMSMGNSAAAATHSTAAATADGHCQDHQKPAEKSPKMDMHCASCSALPAAEAIVDTSALKPATPRQMTVTDDIAGNEPEIATPPPKLI